MSAQDARLVRLARGAGYNALRPVPFADEVEHGEPMRLRRCRSTQVVCVRCFGSGLVKTTRDYTAICPDCGGAGNDKEDA